MHTGLMFQSVALLLPSVRGSQEANAVAGKAAAGGVTQAPKVLEEWEVPYKYRRPLITEEEIEYINVSCRISVYMYSK